MAKKSPILISINIHTDGSMNGILGADFGRNRKLAGDVVRLMFPSCRADRWEKTPGGWKFFGVMATGFAFPEK